MNLSTADIVWGSLLLAGAVFEVYALLNARQGDTLSERTRTWFRVRTPLGALVFGFAWCGFAIWYLAHILA